MPIKREMHEYANVANVSQRHRKPMFMCGLQSRAAYVKLTPFRTAYNRTVARKSSAGGFTSVHGGLAL